MYKSMEFSSRFVAIGANRSTQACVWGNCGLFVFAAGTLVAFFYPEDPIISTLVGHKDRVVAVRLLEDSGGRSPLIVSASADGVVHIWNKTEPNNGYEHYATLLGHNAPITAMTCATQMLEDQSTLCWAVIGDSTGVIKIWQFFWPSSSTRAPLCLQTWSENARYPTSVAICFFTKLRVPIIAVATTDCKVLLYIYEKNQFMVAVTLIGHENWIKDMAFTTDTSQRTENGSIIQNGDILLASASQDKYIRIWRLSAKKHQFTSIMPVESGDDEWQHILNSIKDESYADSSALQLSTRAHAFLLPESKQLCTVILDSIILGHDDWVYSVSWAPRPCNSLDENNEQPMRLLSTSADKSMIIWTLLEGVWVPEIRVGEVGGTVLGYWCGAWAPNGRSIAGVGYSGAIHIWKQEADRTWKPQVGQCGHTGPVEDISWDPTQTYLLSTSLDQTTRIFAPYVHSSVESVMSHSRWHEIARPQVHGYDINCLSFISKFRFVSGADEKVLRVFDCPRTFVKSLSNLTQRPPIAHDDELNSLPVGANLPALGLSNKVINNGETQFTTQSDIDCLAMQNLALDDVTTKTAMGVLDQPPTEEYLLQNTLWPEVEKLYGHAYEIISVMASNQGDIVASTCKAATVEHAVIRLYDTSDWKELPKLSEHSLTITRMRFSLSDRFLLSVSRDRGWVIWERIVDESGRILYMRSASLPKAHARIIWDCCWSWDEQIFVTVSRDKTAKVWQWHAPQVTLLQTITLPDAVTSVAFAPRLIQDNDVYRIACGLENGRIVIFSSQSTQPSVWNEEGSTELSLSHGAPVHAMTFRIVELDGSNEQSLELASCSEDHSVRLYSLQAVSRHHLGNDMSSCL